MSGAFRWRNLRPEFGPNQRRFSAFLPFRECEVESKQQTLKIMSDSLDDEKILPDALDLE